MSTLAPAPSSALGRGRACPAPSLLHDLGGEPTLDELLTRVWEGLAAHRSASCPVCGGHMTPSYGAHARQPDDSGAAQLGEAGRAGRSRMTRARPVQARLDAERAASSSEGGRCQSCNTALS